MSTKDDKKTTALQQQKRHRTVPIPNTITYVEGYPKKLTLYKNEASSYWQVRYYSKGKIVRRSTKTDKLSKAKSFAKDFFNEINLRESLGVSLTNQTAFTQATEAMLKSMKGQLEREEITKQTYINADYRIRKSITPFFKNKDVKEVHYDDLELYLIHLSKQKPSLSSATISGYMKLVRKILNHAYKRRLIQNVPHFPVVKGTSNARGYFTTEEYRKLWSRARALVGKRFEYRKLKNKNGEEQLGQYFESGKVEEGRKIRDVEITPELHEMIVFMVNSFIRPTDIKNLKHKHVDIVRKDNNYLRLRLPASKKHHHPIVTMEQAIEVYERLKAHNKAEGRGVGKEDYVFFPNYTNRDYALQQLQRQFDVLIKNLGLEKGPTGEARTIYSLRHTCIMFRLTEGEPMDNLTLARNSRTSVEMIDRFYASQLQGEHNIGLLQAKRKKRL